MNVKISGKGLRFKITAEELETLLGGNILMETLSIGRKKLSLSVDPAGVNEDMVVSWDEDTIRLLISPAKVKMMADMGRCKDGLEQKEGAGPAVSLQVDLRTQKRQPS